MILNMLKDVYQLLLLRPSALLGQQEIVDQDIIAVQDIIVGLAATPTLQTTAAIHAQNKNTINTEAPNKHN
jgi:hypothetical protein